MTAIDIGARKGLAVQLSRRVFFSHVAHGETVAARPRRESPFIFQHGAKLAREIIIPDTGSSTTGSKFGIEGLPNTESNALGWRGIPESQAFNEIPVEFQVGVLGIGRIRVEAESSLQGNIGIDAPVSPNLEEEEVAGLYGGRRTVGECGGRKCVATGSKTRSKQKGDLPGTAIGVGVLSQKACVNNA